MCCKMTCVLCWAFPFVSVLITVIVPLTSVLGSLDIFSPDLPTERELFESSTEAESLLVSILKNWEDLA